MINPKDLVAGGFREVAPPPERVVRWTVPRDLAYFDGHFPGQPTLPAVAMVDLSLELVRRWPGFEMAELHTLRLAKFTAVISPGAEVQVSLVRENPEGSVEGRAEWRAEWSVELEECASVPAARFLFSTEG